MGILKSTVRIERHWLFCLVLGAALLVACGDQNSPGELTTLTSAPTTTSAPPATTTTSPPTTAEAVTTSTTTTAASSFAGDGEVGVVGCSITANAVDGYLGIGGSRLWDLGGDYAGASVGRWANDLPSGPLWNAFQSRFGEGTEAIWWQLCTFGGSPRDGIESARAVLNELRARVGEIPIFVSAQPEYDPVGSCDLAGPEGPAFMAEVASELIETEGLEPGPAMGPLRSDQTNGGCHANESGEDVLGNQLLSFFD